MSAARLRAYALMEDAQGHDHAGVDDRLAELETETELAGWPELALLAQLGHALWGVVRSPDRAAVEKQLEAALLRAQTLGVPALLALALALRAVLAVGRDDTDRVLTDAGRAVGLVDDPAGTALDRCTVLVVCAAAYNGLSLWELADELYERAAELEPHCEAPVQAPALAANRVLVRLERATELLELGSTDEASRHLRRAATAAELALDVAQLPDLWRREMEAAHTLLALVVPALEDPATGGWTSWVDDRLAEVAGHRAGLAEAGDVELLPLLDALLALGLQRLGRREDALAAARALVPPGSSSSGARSFPAWVRSELLAAEDRSEASAAQREYAGLLARSRWTARQGVLAAARARIDGERLSVDHARLSRDVLLDPLTGLANRRAFDEWLEQTPPRDRTTALLLIDLDSFKEVNDVHGHAVGDEVLRRVGHLLSGHVRAGDLALRLGGDELAMVLQDDHAEPPPDPDEALAVFARTAAARARALGEAVESTDWDLVSSGLDVRISVGVAVAVLGSGHPEAARRLYLEADTDLYAAKARRRVARGSRAPAVDVGQVPRALPDAEAQAGAGPGWQVGHQ